MLDQLRRIVSNALPPKQRARAIHFWYNTISPALLHCGVGRLIRPALLRQYLSRPDEVDVEVTSTCDADCIMCPRRSMSRRQGAMPFDLFKKIVDESVAIGVKSLTLNGYGEISTVKNYKEYLGYIRQRSRSIRISINSNGMRMDEEMARSYIEHEVGLVNVTIDGATAETFESVRKHLKLEQVESNVRRLVELRNKAGKKFPIVRVGIIDMPQTHDEIPMFLKKWTGVVDCVGVGGLVSRMESISWAVRKDRKRWETTPCWLLWQQMPILVDGTVALCCDEWNGEYPLGNVRDSTIRELWTSHRERMRFRELHLTGRVAEIGACNGCRSPRGGPWWFQGIASGKKGAPTEAGSTAGEPRSSGLVVLND